MSILRNPGRARFTVIDNSLLEDDRLSWGAKGLLTYLLSKPDGWEINQAHIENIGLAGRYKVRKLFSELYEFGYLIQRQIRSDKGFLTGSEVILAEAPTAENRNAVKPESQKTGMPENRRQVNTDTSVNTEVSNYSGKRASKRCPSDWQPMQQDIDTLLAEFPHITVTDIQRWGRTMVDYEFKTAKKDWDATFRNWIRSDAERSKGKSNGQAGRSYQTPAELIDQDRRERLERIRQLEAGDDAQSRASVVSHG